MRRDRIGSNGQVPDDHIIEEMAAPVPGSRDALDQELRDLLLQIFPHLVKNKMHLILPEIERDQLTVGKLFSGLAILENWRRYRASMRRRELLKRT